MVNDCSRSPLVGIASVVCGVVLAMGILAMLFLPAQLATIGKIAGYLVILGIILGFFQYTLDREFNERKEREGRLLAKKRK